MPQQNAHPEAEKDLAAARARLSNAGLGCHKEVIGLPNALGYEVARQTSPVTYELKLPVASNIHPIFHVSLLKIATQLKVCCW